MKYRKKTEIELYIFKWLGDESLIDEINKTLKIVNKKHKDRGNFKVGLSQENKSVLGLTHSLDDGFTEGGIHQTTSWTYKEQYIVLDLNEDVMPFRALDKDVFNYYYEEI